MEEIGFPGKIIYTDPVRARTRMEISMNRIKNVILIAFGFVLVLGGIASITANDGDDETAIRKTIDDNIGWFKDKDFDLLFRTIPDDSAFFIFHPDSKSTIRSREEFLKFSEIFRNPELKYAGHEIRELNVRRSRSGDVAWFLRHLRRLQHIQGPQRMLEGLPLDGSPGEARRPMGDRPNAFFIRRG